MNGISRVISIGWDIDAVLENGRRSERFITRQENPKTAVTENFHTSNFETKWGSHELWGASITERNKLGKKEKTRSLNHFSEG